MNLAYIGVFISLTLGMIAFLKPYMIASFVSINPIGKEGLSEIQATYGGFFFGISAYTLYSKSEVCFILIGCGWFSASTVRLITLFNGNCTKKNIAGVIFESITGLACLSILL